MSEAELRPLAAHLDALLAELLPDLAMRGGVGAEAAGAAAPAAEATAADAQPPAAGAAPSAPSLGLLTDPAATAAACASLNTAYEAVRTTV